MFEQALSPDTKSNLEILNQEKFISPFYLAGGTAIALHLGHRFSYDLDFFTPETFSSRDIITRLKELGKFDLESEAENTLVGIFNKIRISFFTYGYPLLFPLQVFENINIADLRDIACMKLDAISSRGRKRDFIDLYAICQEGISLEGIFNLFTKKYKGTGYSLIHIIKSLSYFTDAEKDEMPDMIKKVGWKEAKAFFENESKRIATQFAK